jgi:hypothetical protein
MKAIEIFVVACVLASGIFVCLKMMQETLEP